ncbi:MAG: hypothetical protein U5L09_21710 [Bacteroidales bacterium]|nr:hypothetical protein [Bacteroidales bacterium]
MVVNAIHALDNREGDDKKIVIEAYEADRCAKIVVADTTAPVFAKRPGKNFMTPSILPEKRIKVPAWDWPSLKCL